MTFSDRKAEWLGWAGVATGVLLFVLAAFRISMSRDEGGFVTISAMMLDGARIYEHIIDRKGPLLWGTVYALFKVTGPSLFAARALMFAACAFAGWMTWRIAGHLGLDRPWRVASLAAYALLIPLFRGFGVFTEHGVLVFGSLAVLILLTSGDHPPKKTAIALAGLLMGLATGYKLVAIFYVAAAGAWLIVCGFHDRRGLVSGVLDAIVLGVGWAVSVAAVLLWFVPSGRFEAAYYCNWVLSTSQYDSMPFNPWIHEIAFQQIFRAAVLWAPASLLGAIAVYQFLRRGADRNVALLALVVAFSFYPSLKQPYEHYVISYLPVLSVLGVVGWKRFAEYLEEHGRSVVLAVVAVAVMSLGNGVYTATVFARKIYHDGLGTQLSVGQRIREYIEPGEPIYVVAAEPAYYLLSGSYRHFPPLFIIPGNEMFAPPELLLDRVKNDPDVRYVLLADMRLAEIREFAEDVRERGEFLFADRPFRRGEVEFYRLPPEMRGDYAP